MELPATLSTVLTTLSESLAPSGADLEAMLSVLSDDLAASVPSFIGLVVHVRVGLTSLTFSTMTAEHEMLVQSSLSMPSSVVKSRSHITFYASRPRAFAALAADAINWSEVIGGFDLDLSAEKHDAPPHDDFEDFGTINQALGVLMHRGLSAHDARISLERTAGAAGLSVARYSERLLESTGTGSAPPAPPEGPYG